MDLDEPLSKTLALSACEGAAAGIGWVLEKVKGASAGACCSARSKPGGLSLPTLRTAPVPEGAPCRFVYRQSQSASPEPRPLNLET